MTPLTIDELFDLGAKLARYRFELIHYAIDGASINESKVDSALRDTHIAETEQMLSTILDDISFQVFK